MKKLVFCLCLCACVPHKYDVNFYEINNGNKIYTVKCHDSYNNMYECTAHASEFCNGDFSNISDNYNDEENLEKDINFYSKPKTLNWIDLNSPLKTMYFYCNKTFWDNF